MDGLMFRRVVIGTKTCLSTLEAPEVPTFSSAPITLNIFPEMETIFPTGSSVGKSFSFYFITEYNYISGQRQVIRGNHPTCGNLIFGNQQVVFVRTNHGDIWVGPLPFHI